MSGVRSRLLSYWKGMTLPYPEPGIRLIRQTDITRFDEQMTVFEAQLAAAVDQLASQYGELKSRCPQTAG